jgi:hypothetical protein
MAPASKLSKRTPLSDASDDDDTSSESGSEGSIENDNENKETFPEITIDVTKLNPLSPEVIQKQATINIGACVSLCFVSLAVACPARSCSAQMGYVLDGVKQATQTMKDN